MTSRARRFPPQDGDRETAGGFANAPGFKNNEHLLSLADVR